MATYLDAILEWHRARAAADDRPVPDLIERARSMPTPRRFEGALRDAAAAGQLAVIAEVKRRSPSLGALVDDLNAPPLAEAYERGGAACLSVLTDEEHFGGSPTDLMQCRAVVSIPVLRKDFTVSPRDVAEARLMGADACLLIVAALAQDELAELVATCHDVRIDPLVECHDEDEVARALAAGATLIGVNQRDLHTFQVDTQRAERVAAALPDHVVRIAESGIDGPDTAARLKAAGYQAVLVGEHLVRAEDPVAAIQALIGA